MACDRIRRDGTAIGLIFGIGFGVFASQAAFADKAPIRYGPAPDGYYGSAPVSAGSVAPRQTVASIAPSGGRRTEFRYPDQPHVVYGGGQGPRSAGSTAPPIAFSSSTTAVSVDAAKAAVPTAAPAPRDPALSAGAFDARAAAMSVQPIPAPQPQPTRAVSRSKDASLFESTRVGKPYQINGQWYEPTEDPDYDETGTASWYGPGFHGKPTATGEIFDENAMTAAHPTLPIPSLVQVINLETGQEIVVRVNDRGPFIDNRIIDLSKRAADVLGFKAQGHAPVRVRYLGPAPTLPGAAGVRVAEAQPLTRQVAQPVPVQTTPVAPPMAPSYGGHFVQVGSFSDLANARALHDRLVGQFPVDVVSARVNGADFFRVMVGPAMDETEAQRLQQQLVSAGLSRGLVVAAR